MSDDQRNLTARGFNYDRGGDGEDEVRPGLQDERGGDRLDDARSVLAGGRASAPEVAGSSDLAVSRSDLAAPASDLALDGQRNLSALLLPVGDEDEWCDERDRKACLAADPEGLGCLCPVGWREGDDGA